MQELFELVRRLVDIPSVTGAEGPCAEFLAERLRRGGFAVELQPVSEDRANVFAVRGKPDVVLSTHMDTVAPHFASSEDADWIYGRGACDAKGVLACQLVAAEQLLSEDIHDFALLFLVGEETVSDGARAANRRPVGSRYLIAGEPTENRLVVATKGVLHLHLRARGRAAHSAYPERGESAIEKLLDSLDALRAMPLPRDPELGPTTMNIGRISGGVGANVVAAEAEATILFRTVGDTGPLIHAVEQAVDGRAECEFPRSVGPTRLDRMPGFETDVAAFTTDVPNLSRWGRPLLIGPGSIFAAHGAEERVAKRELVRAVEQYKSLVRALKSRVGQGGPSS